MELIEKLEQERNELKIKIDKLDKFLQEDNENINDKHYMLLLTQFHIMQSYRIILDLRIKDIQNKGENNA